MTGYAELLIGQRDTNWLLAAKRQFALHLLGGEM